MKKICLPTNTGHPLDTMIIITSKHKPKDEDLQDQDISAK